MTWIAYQAAITRLPTTTASGVGPPLGDIIVDVFLPCGVMARSARPPRQSKAAGR